MTPLNQYRSRLRVVVTTATTPESSVDEIETMYDGFLVVYRLYRRTPFQLPMMTRQDTMYLLFDVRREILDVRHRTIEKDVPDLDVIDLLIGMDIFGTTVVELIHADLTDVMDYDARLE